MIPQTLKSDKAEVIVGYETPCTAVAPLIEIVAANPEHAVVEILNGVAVVLYKGPPEQFAVLYENTQ